MKCSLLQEVNRLWGWVSSKTGELHQLDHRDAYMAHLVLQILQTSKANSFAYVDLSDLHPLHPTDNRENTVAAIEKRAAVIEKRKDALLEKKHLSKEVIAELMPSATYIRVISRSKGGFVTFEGNGRVAALNHVFVPSDGIRVEVDVYHPKRLRNIERMVKKLHKMHGM